MCERGDPWKRPSVGSVHLEVQRGLERPHERQLRRAQSGTTGIDGSDDDRSLRVLVDQIGVQQEGVVVAEDAGASEI